MPGDTRGREPPATDETPAWPQHTEIPSVGRGRGLPQVGDSRRPSGGRDMAGAAAETWLERRQRHGWSGVRRAALETR
eukprot:1207267-Pleurochrysis_carterae.AAC.1